MKDLSHKVRTTKTPASPEAATKIWRACQLLQSGAPCAMSGQMFLDKIDYPFKKYTESEFLFNCFCPSVISH